MDRVVHDLSDAQWTALKTAWHGPAFVGNVGAGAIKDFTAIGDVVNTAERLQASALAGQIVVSEEVYEHLGSRYPNAPRETLKVKGRVDAVQARRLQPTPARSP